MMPERIGIIGNTHGVNDRSTPMPKKVASTASRLPSRINKARRSCSETKMPLPDAPAFAGATAPSAVVEAVLEPELPAPATEVAPPAGRLTLKFLVTGE